MKNQWLAVISSGQWSDTMIYIVGAFDSEEEANGKANKLADRLNDLAHRAGSAFLAEDYELEDKIEEEYSALLQVSHAPPIEDWIASVAPLNGGLHRLM